MKKALITDVSFDEEDLQLFKLTGDLLLKAKSIQYSILPKLNIILEESLSNVRTIYGIEVFNERSIIHSWPSFREKREHELKLNYTSSFIGITGTRTPVWNGFKRTDGKVVKIIPYRFGFQLSEYGLELVFFSSYNKLKLSYESYKMYFDFINNNLPLFFSIIMQAKMEPDYYLYLEEEKEQIVEQIVRPIDKIIVSILKHDDYTLNFHRIISTPISSESINDLVQSFVIFFPVYDMVLNFASKKENRIFSLYEKFTYKNVSEFNITTENDDQSHININDVNILNKYLDNKNIVKAGIRWQVFERDNFRCVACGASAQDGAILHVDHIIPRSKGGKDSMDNYQTLCHLCNIGKSNKSDRDLRQ